MSHKAETYLLPVLDARAEALRQHIEWDKRYDHAFESLLQAKGSAAREARVALMDYYIGESYAEELVCAVAMDNSPRLLRLYSTCDIQPARSPIPRERTLPLRKYALELITKGDVKPRCTYK